MQKKKYVSVTKREAQKKRTLYLSRSRKQITFKELIYYFEGIFHLFINAKFAFRSHSLMIQRGWAYSGIVKMHIEHLDFHSFNKDSIFGRIFHI